MLKKAIPYLITAGVVIALTAVLKKVLPDNIKQPLGL